MSQQDRERLSGSLTSRVARFFSKNKSKLTSLPSLMQRADEPDTLPQPVYPLSSSPARRTQFYSSRVQPQLPATRRSDSFKSLQHVRSLPAVPQILTNTDSAPYLRYSLQDTTELRVPLRPLRPLNQEYPSLADFDVKRTIGTGTFARVKLVQHRADGTYLALKAIRKVEVLRLKQLQHVLSEKSILAKVNHPFIVHLHSAYQDDDRLYMLMDYVPGGELFKHLRSQPCSCFPVSVARFYAASILLALEYLHANDIIYRDLKPENLLLDSGGYLKMTDFGFAKEVGSRARTWTLCGTPEYLAPEIVKDEGHGKAVDWWCMGVVLYEMLVGRPPFCATHPVGIYRLIVAGDYQLPDYLDADAQLQKDLDKDDSALQDLIRQLLEVDATRRLGSLQSGSRDIKHHPFFADLQWRDLLLGRVEPPNKPVVKHSGDTGNYEPYVESVDDPHSPMLDLATAQRVFRGF